LRLKYVELTFENCDTIKIDGKYIGEFCVEDIRPSVRRIACNSIDKINIAHTIIIEIHKDANKERYEFGNEVENFKQMTFDRIKEYNDITSIRLEFEKPYAKEEQMACIESYDYLANWVGDDDNSNEAQKTYLSKPGNLYLIIADGKKIEDFFSLEDIEDNERMELKFHLYGDKYSNKKKNKEGKEDNKMDNVEDKEIVYDFGEAINFIAERCNVDKSAIETVLDLEEGYMRSIGIIY